MKARQVPLLIETGVGGSGDASNKNATVGRWIHYLFCFLPLVGSALIILVLVELWFRLQLNIFAITISDGLAFYDPYWQILVPALVGGSIMFVVTVARNIQIKVYFTRCLSYSLPLSILNFVAAVANIAAYGGYIALMLFQTNPNGDGGQEEDIHYLGSVVYFSLSSVYGILHTYLLLRQTQYPFAVKAIFVLVAAVAAISTALYAIFRDQVFVMEWIAVLFAAIYVLLFTILFHIDSVDDELAQFFCCCCRRRKATL
jgi:hypothetical protein